MKMGRDMPDVQLKASICPGVVAGFVVMVKNEAVIYAGPIKGAPDDADGALMLLNCIDFAKLQDIVTARKRGH